MKLILPILIFSFSVLAQSESKNIIVSFHRKITPKERDALHTHQQNRLYYRSHHLDLDIVKVENGKTAADACQQYLNLEAVTDCREPQELTAFDPNSCGPEDELQKLINFQDELTCEVVPTKGLPSYMYGLSPKWALEYTGADLMKKFLKEFTKANLLNPTSMAVVDVGFDPKILQKAKEKLLLVDHKRPEEISAHGTMVYQQMFDADVGTAVKANLALAITSKSDDKLIVGLEKIADSDARIINISMGMGNHQQLAEAWSLLTARDKIVVGAAGNGYPLRSTDLKHGVSSSVKHISVGSLDPFGLPSFFSLNEEHVTVLAPADMYALSKDADGRYEQFEATSSAAPLTSGVASNLLSILPELTFDETEKILRMSSLSTRIQKDAKTQKNGAGLLNAYRAIKVAAKLKELGFPIDREKLLNQADLIDFATEASAKQREAQEILARAKREPGHACQLRKAAFENLREAFFLMPSQKSAEAIAKLYKENNYPVNGMFFKSLFLLPQEVPAYLDELKKDTTSEEKIFLGMKIIDEGKVADRALLYTSRLPEDHPWFLLVKTRIEKKAKDPDPKVRLEVLRDMRLAGQFSGITQLLKDPSPEVREKANKLLIDFEGQSYCKFAGEDGAYCDRARNGMPEVD